MNIPLSDLPGIMAAQHRVLKDLKKKTGLRQRDWEVLCACQRLSLASYPFTAAKVDAFLQGAYFLPCLYDSLKVLLGKGYLRVVVPGKPFRPESYELTYGGKCLVMRTAERMFLLSEAQEKVLGGVVKGRLW
ncbi:hypothetical protein ACD591_01145 [Rufibacter glacialis]|uniref:Uncharacterized protein n=1 Tax=Rufibacter glacialis TaxID=1259555 RepID=A0A5M8QHJ8_9BACT|nr:hypothetical protein [Rufibacter glacialis]KAA6435505.1 hypothetical protein FOE74_06045 [Rufibacter glacialis]GGK64093.1 hypothetical protein GCM10011405_10090 [Rufibacter glacialis]